ncbi:hypothetical protein H6P81_016555 [Aristolochia fimbriata]|uniref:Uncharacterized protein n=1 Tax=Aristolochia fimbriata TaxID=158543 RepID=A0AAV7E8L2_ARIFI|nr:hypothetical protein H6P81_016555 [Aristolochia fimbriata]
MSLSFFQVLPEGGIGLLQHCQLCLLSSICIAMSLRRVLHNFNKLWDAFISFSMMAEGPEISNLAFCNISKANSAVLCCVHNISKADLDAVTSTKLVLNSSSFKRLASYIKLAVELSSTRVASSFSDADAKHELLTAIGAYEL